MADNEIKVKITGKDELSPTVAKALQSLSESNLKLTESVNKISESSQGAQRNTQGLHGGLITLSAGVQLLSTGVEIAGKAFDALAGVVHKAVEEALEAEKANTLLRGALIATGQYTAKTSKEINELAENLEKAVGANGEAVRSMIAMGVQMGLSTQKAIEMEAAARKLAAATGTTVEEAFQKLRMSLAGNARGLALVLPQIKEFGAAQLKQGAGIDLVNKSLGVQYDLYQKTLPAALEKAKVGYDNVYKAFGQMITESPALKAAISTAAEQFNTLAKYLEDNKSSVKGLVGDGIILLIDALEGVNIVADKVVRHMDVIKNAGIGAISALSLGFVTLVDGPIALLYKGLSLLPGVGEEFNAKADAIIANAGAIAAKVNESADNINKAFRDQTEGSKSFENGLLKVREAVLQAEQGERALASASDASAEATARANAAMLAKGKTYAEVAIGTQKQREALKAEVEDRQSDLKDFQDYLAAKQRLAITSAQEQEIELNKIKANALKGAGPAGTQSQSTAEVDAETVKQAQLDVLRQKGIISLEEYQQAKLASEQRAAEAELAFQQAHQQQLAMAMGDTPEAFELKLALEQERFQLRMAQREQQALQEGASEQQRTDMLAQMHTEHLANSTQETINYYNKQAQQEELAGNRTAAYLARERALQAQHGKALGALKALEQSEQFKATQTALGNLSSLMSSHDKDTFEIGKAAAIANATINTAMAASKSLAQFGYPIGAIFAAAAVAAGAVQIAQIQATNFTPPSKGGQADQGMDNIPQSLSGKSFVLSAGEAVIQPEANRDLRAFLKKESEGSERGGSTVIHVTINGNASKEDARKMTDVIIDELRRASDRGRPIINEKGIVRNI